jgi:hypothetical protein
MDVKETLKNLHKRFPNYTLDELFDILDCVVPNYYVTYTNNTYDYKLTCDSSDQK